MPVVGLALSVNHCWTMAAVYYARNRLQDGAERWQGFDGKACGDVGQYLWSSSSWGYPVQVRRLSERRSPGA